MLKEHVPRQRLSSPRKPKMLATSDDHDDLAQSNASDSSAQPLPPTTPAIAGRGGPAVKGADATTARRHRGRKGAGRDAAAGAPSLAGHAAVVRVFVAALGAPMAFAIRRASAAAVVLVVAASSRRSARFGGGGVGLGAAVSHLLC